MPRAATTEPQLFFSFLLGFVVCVHAVSAFEGVESIQAALGTGRVALQFQTSVPKIIFAGLQPRTDFLYLAATLPSVGG